LKIKAKMDILRIVSELEMENNQQTTVIRNQNSVYVNYTCSSPASSKSLHSGISTYNYSTTTNSLGIENIEPGEESMTSKHFLNQHEEVSSNFFNNHQILNYKDSSQNEEYIKTIFIISFNFAS